MHVKLIKKGGLEKWARHEKFNQLGTRQLYIQFPRMLDKDSIQNTV